MSSEPSDRPGYFVTLEGIDGSGKTTAMEAIREHYQHGIYTSEPSAMKTGPWVREAISDWTDIPLRDFYLYMADRAGHIDATVRPALQDDRMVVCDRYSDSTRAYQYHALDGAVDDPEAFIESTMAEWELTPDLTIYLDVPAHTAIQRVSDGDQYEKEEFLRSVRSRYLDIAQRFDRIVTVDTRGLTPEEVQSRVLEVMEDHYE